MSRESNSKTIDGHEYMFTQFGAKQSLKLLMRISKIVGKPLALAIGAGEGGGKFLDRVVNPEVLAQAVEALVTRLDEDEVLDIIETLTATGCLCDGGKIDFNSHYQQRLPLMVKVLMAALEVQYGNFFDGFSALLPARPPSTPAQAT